MEIIGVLIGKKWVAQGMRAMGTESSGAPKLRIPESLGRDHQEILEQLENSARTPGKTGDVARELRELLMPHFRREEQTALPMLGALVEAAMWKVDPATTEQVLTLHRSLRHEYARMLEEHEQIGKVLLRLLETAESEANTKVVAFVRHLLHHRRMEEEVLYPAAIVLGDRLQAARGARTHAPHPSRPYKH
jgi:hemerythrin-like domain-containing protein